MSIPIPIEDLARVSFPNRSEQGQFIMLECYLDDSGTHSNSRVIVWGGVAGDKNFFDQFQEAWKARLEDPCDGYKPPINVFHSTDLAAGDGEFSGYSQAERDRTRFNFRQVIIDCDLTWVSYGISVKAWESVAKDYEWSDILSAESMVFGRLIRDVTKSAIDHGDPIAFKFDKGRISPLLCGVIQPAFDSVGVNTQSVGYGFWSVQAVLGLQGADLIAHETYQYFVKFIDDPNTNPSSHLQKLMDGAFSYKDGWFDEDSIRRAFEEADKSYRGGS